jgi:hypothetical protein
MFRVREKNEPPTSDGNKPAPRNFGAINLARFSFQSLPVNHLVAPHLISLAYLSKYLHQLIEVLSEDADSENPDRRF